MAFRSPYALRLMFKVASLSHCVCAAASPRDGTTEADAMLRPSPARVSGPPDASVRLTAPTRTRSDGYCAANHVTNATWQQHRLFRGPCSRGYSMADQEVHGIAAQIRPTGPLRLAMDQNLIRESHFPTQNARPWSGNGPA